MTKSKANQNVANNRNFGDAAAMQRGSSKVT